MSADLFSKIPIFNDARPEFFQALSTDAQEKTSEKGHVLFIHGEPAERFYLIKRGWVKLFRETVDGSQVVIDILTNGHLIGDTSIFENGCYAYSAEVVERSEIISLPISALKSEIENNGAVSLAMLRSMAKYRRQQDLEIEHLSIQNASQRIGCFLLRLIDQRQTGAVTITLPYDKTLVASKLGMQPETFSRALSKLKQKTGIRVAGAQIHIDSLSQLSSFCCNACSSEFPCKDVITAG